MFNLSDKSSAALVRQFHVAWPGPWASKLTRLLVDALRSTAQTEKGRYQSQKGTQKQHAP
jgi:hypothetical protein